MKNEVQEHLHESELLKFQRSLSKQFMAVMDEEKQEQHHHHSNVETDKLGIGVDYGNVQLFLPLEDFKTISSKSSYENSLRSKSWLLGFNQERGDVYTIFELEKAVALITKNESDYDKIDERSKQVIYLKDVDSHKQAFFLKLDNESSQYTAEFTPIFHRSEHDNLYKWSISEDIEFDSFIQEDNMSAFEWQVMNYLKERVEKNEPFKKDEFVIGEPHILFAQMVKDVSLDGMGVRPVFVLDVLSFTRYLNSVSPF